MKISLLVVEDDNEASKIIQTLLAMKLPEVAVRVAENGRLGLEACRQQIPDIVITDLNMPDMDGVGMMEQIKELNCDTRFIVITGYSDKRERLDSLDIYDYFVKPTDFRKLLATLGSCISEIEATRS